MKHRRVIACLAALAFAAAAPDSSARTAAQASSAETQAGTAYFTHDSDAVSPSAAAQLDKVAALYATSKLRVVRVRGHADRSEGEDGYCVGLAQRRSNNVRSYLVTRGVTDNDIITETFGCTKPVKPKGPATANRRVEVWFSATSGW